jgi:ABC-type transport system substrate-binding protein
LAAFDWPALNIANGTAVTFQLRDDVSWHDGEPVTVEDVQFAWAFMAHFPQFSVLSEQLAWVDVLDPCTIRAYLNVTSPYVLYNLAEVALLFPEHIYSHSPVAGPYAGADPLTAPVWAIPYVEWQGVPGPTYPFMVEELKALIGCGPYVFDYYDNTTEVIHVVKNPLYWVDGPLQPQIRTAVDGEATQRVAPGEVLEYWVQVVNAGATVAGSFAAATVDFIELTVDGSVVETIPGPLTVQPFNTTGWLGPFTATFAAKGPHYVDCHVWEEGTIIDECELPVCVTIPEDVTSDFTVDVYDVVRVALVFGAQRGEAAWEWRADVREDGVIDIFDLVCVARQFGWA